MKNLLIAIFMILFGTGVNAKEVITIESKSSVKLNYEQFKSNVVEIKNKSMQTFDVRVQDAATEEWVKGFGLNAQGKAVVDVAPTHDLVLTNNSKKDITVVLEFKKRVEEQARENVAGQYITFTLHNSSSKSIPLVIPTVMNPNLSPFSNSGVKLQVGQKIFYKKNGKKKLLLVVDESIAEGEKVDVAALIASLEQKQQ